MPNGVITTSSQPVTRLSSSAISPRWTSATAFEVGQVRDRARVRDQREAFAVERAVEPARVGDRDFGGLERHEVLLVRVGVEERPLLGALGIADRGAHVGHAGSNSSVSIVGRIAS